ncbi:hypothetical protein IPO96_04480 [Candidatus Saccharibacteria bacterium]|jgi:hypothetical protein|nr:MAG: hypothetical protein IPO96_04480 [Candidatus Saccharibacteria bacterium]
MVDTQKTQIKSSYELYLETGTVIDTLSFPVDVPLLKIKRPTRYERGTGIHPSVALLRRLGADGLRELRRQEYFDNIAKAETYERATGLQFPID